MDPNLTKRMNNLFKVAKQDQSEEYNCPICKDRGYTFEYDEEGYEVARPCKCLAKKRALERIERSGLSKAFKQRTFETYNTDKPYQKIAKLQARSFCDGFQDTNSSLILTGQSGAGKTHLGCAVMLELINTKNVFCKYELYTTMLLNLKQSTMDKENYIKEMAKYQNPTVLFIDDFLKIRPTEADFRYIFEIVNYRYLNNKALIISTEKTIDEIIDWDEAIGGRLKQMAQGNVIEFKRDSSHDYRLGDKK